MNARRQNYQAEVLEGVVEDIEEDIEVDTEEEEEGVQTTITLKGIIKQHIIKKEAIIHQLLTTQIKNRELTRATPYTLIVTSHYDYMV